MTSGFRIWNPGSQLRVCCPLLWNAWKEFASSEGCPGPGVVDRRQAICVENWSIRHVPQTFSRLILTRAASACGDALRFFVPR